METPTYPQLCSAIDKADAPALRAMLKIVCQEPAELRKYTAKHLMAPVTPLESKKRKSLDGGDNVPNKKTCLPVISRYERCITCKSTFDVTKNRDTACKTHEGTIVMPEDHESSADVTQNLSRSMKTTSRTTMRWQKRIRAETGPKTGASRNFQTASSGCVARRNRDILDVLCKDMWRPVRRFS